MTAALDEFLTKTKDNPKRTMVNVNDSLLSRLYLKDTAFQQLMQKRIFNVL